MDETGEIEDYKAMIKDLKEELRKKDDRINELREHILSLETEQPLNSKKRKKLSSVGEIEMSEEIIKEMYDKDLKIQKLEQKNEELKAATVRQQAGETVDADKNTNLAQLIEEKLGNGLKSIQANLEKLIEDKLQATLKQTTQEVKPTSYASVVGDKKKNQISGNLKTIIMATKNEEITEERERKRRGKNLIVHGFKEYTFDSVQTSEEEDEKFGKELVKDLQIGIVAIQKVERIGAESTNNTKIRPLKIVFKSEEEQQKVYNNLKNLRGNEDYKGISIKEDYTLGERQLIKDYVEQAKAQNSIEEPKGTGIVWKVRGTPKNGLFLKKFNTMRERTTTTGDWGPQQA